MSFSLQLFPVLRVCVQALLLSLIATSLPAQVPIPNTQVLPYDRGTGPDDRDVPFLAWFEDLTTKGYTEQEILMSGTANVYDYADNASQSAVPQVTASGRAYTTRLLLRYPTDPAKFNGVVNLEILNATSRYDGAPMWDLTFKSIMRDGSAWVGVTYSDTTARFMRDTWGTDAFPAPAGSQPRNRSRYASLDIGNRAYTWDIVNQAAALLKADADARNPMAGMGVDTIVVSGYSQSARYVNTFSNSFYPSYGVVPGDAVVDGFIVGAGGPVASLLNGSGSHPLEDARNFEHANAKTVRFTTESDIGSVLVRQSMADKPLLRTYEVAGASHVDGSMGIVGSAMANYQFGITSSGDTPCDLPFNPIQTGIPLSAIQHRLAKWISSGTLPPPDYFIEYDADTAQWIRDADGNVIGGVRPARIEVPLGSYAGSNPYSGPSPTVEEILCGSIYGSFDAFDSTELEARYGNRITFVLLTWWSMFSQWIDGFIVPADAPTIMNEAKAFTGLPE